MTCVLPCRGVGLYPEAGRFLTFYAVCVVQHYLGELLTVSALALVPNTAIAQSCTTLCLSVFAMVGPGLIRSQGGLPAPVRWLSYTLWYKYASEILVVNEYSGLTFTCPSDNRQCTRTHTLPYNYKQNY